MELEIQLDRIENELNEVKNNILDIDRRLSDIEANKKVAYICEIIKIWGEVESDSLEFDSYICINSLANNRVLEIIKTYSTKGVFTDVSYACTATALTNWKITEGYYSYENLDIKILDKVYEVIKQYEIDMLAKDKLK